MNVPFVRPLVKQKYQVANAENAGFALGNQFKALPWAWTRIVCTAELRADARGPYVTFDIAMGGSYVPSQYLYTNYSLAAKYNMKNDATATSLKRFNEAGWNNDGPGDEIFGGETPGYSVVNP